MSTCDLLTPDYRLRLFEPRDEVFYVDLYSRDDVMRWVGPVVPRETARRAFGAACRHNAAADPGHRFWIVETSPSQPVGLTALKRSGSNAEIGAMVLPEWWNRGVSRQAFRVMAAQAFDHMGIDVIDARRPADAHAVRVNRMLAAVGFRPAVLLVEGSLHWQLTARDLRRS